MSLIRHRPPVATDGGRARSSADGRRSRRTASPACRLVRGVLVVAAGTAALALAGPLALRPFADVAGAAGDVGVAFVLDFGGTSADQVVGCVSVPASDNRYDALSAFVASRGLAPPTYASSGLLCSINGTPGSGCGQTVPGGYVYWSYFTGGPGGWTYASSGASGTVTPNDVEGWRFQDFQHPGSGRPNDPPPRSTAQYSAICPTVPPTTSTTTTAPTPTTPVTAGPVIPAAHGGGGSTAGGSMTTGAATGAGSHPTTTSNSATTASTPSGTSGTGAPGSTVPTHPSSPVTSPSGTDAPTESAIGVASVARHAAPGSGSGPVIVGGLLVAGLSVAAWVRWRKRLGAS